MKQLSRPIIMYLALTWLIGCANSPELAAPTPADRATLSSAPAATAPPAESAGEPPMIVIGDARFVSRTMTVAGATTAAADFDHDGQSDLVSAGEPQLTIFRGDGAGGLNAISLVPGGQQPVDFAVADLNEDGNVDIVVANHDTDYVTILLGDGRGDFQPASNSPLPVDVRPHPHAVQAADLDRDGHVDLVVDHRDAEGLLILRGLGDGRFESPGIIVDAGGDPYLGLAVGDLNQDGWPDLVTPNPREAGILLNAGDGQIAFNRAAPVAAVAPFAVGLGDFNGDGRLDLIAASDEGSDLVELFWGDGQGVFEPAADSPLRLAPGGKNIVVGDFNGDGLADAAVASYQFAEVMLVLGGLDGLRTGHLPADEHPWGLAAADFNGDGRDDLVIADDVTGLAIVYLSVDP